MLREKPSKKVPAFLHLHLAEVDLSCTGYRLLILYYIYGTIKINFGRYHEFIDLDRVD